MKTQAAIIDLFVDGMNVMGCPKTEQRRARVRLPSQMRKRIMFTQGPIRSCLLGAGNLFGLIREMNE